jgi:hypothetical protein
LSSKIVMFYVSLQLSFETSFVIFIQTAQIFMIALILFFFLAMFWAPYICTYIGILFDLMIFFFFWRIVLVTLFLPTWIKSIKKKERCMRFFKKRQKTKENSQKLCQNFWEVQFFCDTHSPICIQSHRSFCYIFEYFFNF